MPTVLVLVFVLVCPPLIFAVRLPVDAASLLKATPAPSAQLGREGLSEFPQSISLLPVRGRSDGTVNVSDMRAAVRAEMEKMARNQKIREELRSREEQQLRGAEYVGIPGSEIVSQTTEIGHEELGQRRWPPAVAVRLQNDLVDIVHDRRQEIENALMAEQQRSNGLLDVASVARVQRVLLETELRDTTMSRDALMEERALLSTRVEHLEEQLKMHKTLLEAEKRRFHRLLTGMLRAIHQFGQASSTGLFLESVTGTVYTGRDDEDVQSSVGDDVSESSDELVVGETENATKPTGKRNSGPVTSSLLSNTSTNRKKLTEMQKSLLSESFSRSDLLTEDALTELMAKTGLKKKEIQNWFQKRRTLADEKPQ